MPSAHRTNPDSPLLTRLLYGSLTLTLVWFYAGLTRFGPGADDTLAHWLVTTWNKENSNYEHAWLVLFVIGWLVWRALPKFRAEPREPANKGLLWIALGVGLYILGCRAVQERPCVVSLVPMILGILHFTQGWKRARHFIFPLSMMGFLIPLPNMEQATTQLALIATKLAHMMGGWLGIKTVLAGNSVYDPSGNWGNWKIDEGCSGIRSIVALMLVTYVYGMIVHKKWSERLVIFAACLPIAIIANAIRVTSILVAARVSVEFASGFWHDYSGFLTFFAALGLLMLVSALMKQGLKALKPKVKVSRRGDPPSSGGVTSAPPVAGAAPDPF